MSPATTLHASATPTCVASSPITATISTSQSTMSPDRRDVGGRAGDTARELRERERRGRQRYAGLARVVAVVQADTEHLTRLRYRRAERGIHDRGRRRSRTGSVRRARAARDGGRRPRADRRGSRRRRARRGRTNWPSRSSAARAVDVDESEHRYLSSPSRRRRSSPGTRVPNGSSHCGRRRHPSGGDVLIGANEQRARVGHGEDGGPPAIGVVEVDADAQVARRPVSHVGPAMSTGRSSGIRSSVEQTTPARRIHPCGSRAPGRLDGTYVRTGSMLVVEATGNRCGGFVGGFARRS